MQCPTCRAEITKVFASHRYSITYCEASQQWVKSTGEAEYTCGTCLGDLDIHDIEDILKLVDEL